MNKRPSHEHHQEVIVDVDPAVHRAGHPRWTDIIHPKVSLIVVSILAFFTVMLFLFWSIPHHDETVALSTGLWRAILGTLTMALTWIVPGLLAAAAMGLVIKWNIKPAIECYHKLQEAFGLKARNKVLAREQAYAVVERNGEPEFCQVNQDRNTYHGKGEIGAPGQAQLPPPQALHIPTFAESLHAGEIGPGQRDVLICHEIIRTDEGEITGDTHAYRDELENNCTMFLGGGSKSGKSTLMVYLAAQEALMGARFYVIDPHLMQPEKSIAKRLEALSPAFILPPAMTDADVFTVLHHARAEALAREGGRETPLSGKPIVFIVDEILNLFGRAQRTTNRDVLQLYRELAFFMRDLGTQYNKFLFNGIFASQYVTKDAFKLPGGDVDFRDGCQSQGLLRLPPNQAQAMRMLTPEELAGMRKLEPGHGYMAFAGGDIIRMAFGNVTRADIEEVARMIDPPKLSRQFSLGARSVPSSTRSEPGCTRIIEADEDTFESTAFKMCDLPGHVGRDTGTLRNPLYSPVEPVQQGTEKVQKVQPKEFSSEQELEFVRLYRTKSDIKECLRAMHLGIGTYYGCASRIVEHRKLKKA